MKTTLPLILLLVALAACQSAPQTQSPSFTISFAQDTIFDGRLLLLISTDESNEPRFQITDRPSTQQVFGMDVEGWQGRTPLSFGAEEYGYPIQSLADLPEGDYYVQALLHKYETFNLKTGHTVKLPMDRGEGQQWNRAPGNLYSKPQKFSIKENSRIELALTEQIPPIEEPTDSKYIKHIKLKSDLLSEFWGRDMYLGAHVLLPEGFDEHPEARYPLAIMHGHFPSDFGGFRTTPPDPDLKPEYSARFDLEGYNKIVQEEEYQFYKDWTGPDFPRFLAIKIQHANPYYDDSYAVNSANLGPYGDAITYELIPHIEKMFRGIGEGWARCVYGGSTGGWEALAVQVKYPDEYGTCYAACPDPIDFRAYCLLNLYEEQNAYNLEGPFRTTKRPGHRDYLGNVDATLEDMNLRELALGTKSRSGQQFDIWEAVYSPQGEDGYPVRIWDKKTGEINQEVLEYWRENYDLSHILQRDWATLGPKLRGKINIYCGDMDNYYLNNAVYLAEEFLENAQPAYEGEVDYGDRAEHCWNGDHTQPNAISRLRYHQMFIPRFAEHLEKTTPAGVKKTWLY
ncbi:MAG: alpha/beta hydrolase-fold protein [Bacteroidota bacterium]